MIYDTAGNKIQEPINCGNCRLDTVGNHEWNCPSNPRKPICPNCDKEMINVFIDEMGEISDEVWELLEKRLN